jgi:hypothetical protein
MRSDLARYSPAKPSTGLHPRPASARTLSPLFPDQLDLTYESTLFPSRQGELIRDLQDRADVFIEAWTGRVEEMGHKSVVIFGHAASVIALGRAVRSRPILLASASTDGYSSQAISTWKSQRAAHLVRCTNGKHRLRPPCPTAKRGRSWRSTDPRRVWGRRPACCA